MQYAVSVYPFPMDARSFNDVFDTEGEAQNYAKEAAGLRPGTTYYVHAIPDSTVTFKAVASVEVEAEYVSGDPE